MKYYILLTLQRSGTHLLESYLTQLGLGTPNPVFYHLRDGKVKDVDELYSIGMKNDTWGVKFHPKHLPVFLEGLKDVSGIDSPLILDILFPGFKVIYLTRKDRLKQAISWVKVENSSHIMYNKNSDFGEYSRERIDLFLGLFPKLERDAEAFFKEYKITPHRIIYEDLCENPAEVLQGILDFLGVNLSIETSLEEHIKGFKLPIRQYDAVSEDWRQRYLRNE